MSKQNMKYKVQVNFYHKSFPLPGVLSVPGVPKLVVLLLHWGGTGAWGGAGGGGHHVLPLKLIALKKSTEVTYWKVHTCRHCRHTCKSVMDT